MVRSFSGTDNSTVCGQCCPSVLCPDRLGGKDKEMKKDANQQSINQRQYYLTIDGENIPVTEEVYRAYKRPDWAEHKRRERSKRCQGENGHRCTGDCSKCKFSKSGGTLSLDSLMDEDGYQAASSEDVAEIVMYGLLLEKLYEELDKLAPTDELILRLFSYGKSEREIAEILKSRSETDPSIVKMSQKTVNNHKNALFAMLREKLKDYR